MEGAQPAVPAVDGVVPGQGPVAAPPPSAPPASPPPADAAPLSWRHTYWSWCCCLPRKRVEPPAVVKVPPPRYRKNPMEAFGLGDPQEGGSSLRPRAASLGDSDAKYVAGSSRAAPAQRASDDEAPLGNPDPAAAGATPGSLPTQPPKSPDEGAPAAFPVQPLFLSPNTAPTPDTRPFEALPIDALSPAHPDSLPLNKTLSIRSTESVGGGPLSPHLGARFGGSWRVYAQHRLHAATAHGSPRAMYTHGGLRPPQPRKKADALRQAAAANEGLTQENLLRLEGSQVSDGPGKKRQSKDAECEAMAKDVGALKVQLRRALGKADAKLAELVAAGETPLPQSETIGAVHATSAVILMAAPDPSPPPREELLDQQQYLAEALALVGDTTAAVQLRLDASAVPLLWPESRAGAADGRQNFEDIDY